MACRRSNSTSLLLAAVLLVGVTSCAPGGEASPQDRITWLGQNALRLHSIDPADDDWSDLEPLRTILGDAQMVLLGEISHGDGSSFLAKTRLIEFLHGEMGFDVLALESGLYDCARAWQMLQAGEEPGRAFRAGAFPIWGRSEQVQPLVDYLGQAARSDHPLELAGFDSQFTGTASSTYLVEELAALLERIGPPTRDRPGWPEFALILYDLTRGAYQSGSKPAPGADEREAFFAELEHHAKELQRAAAGDPEAAFWPQVLASTASHAQALWQALDTHDLDASSQMRDRQMAQNLLWLARQRYPGRKVIVWAASIHLARNLDLLQPLDPEVAVSYPGLRVMGDDLWQEMGQEIYVLAATAYEGRAGTVYASADDLESPTEGSLEDLMARAGLEYAILDLRRPARGGSWLHGEFVSRPFGFMEATAEWSRVLDGLLFIREMAPSHGVP